MGLWFNYINNLIKVKINLKMDYIFQKPNKSTKLIIKIKIKKNININYQSV